MDTLPHEYFISDKTYSIGYAEHEFFLVPENNEPVFDYTKHRPSNCRKILKWGTIGTHNRVNSGVGAITQVDHKINDVIQSISFDFQLGVYSLLKLAVWCFGKNRPYTVYAWKNQYFAKFKKHKDVILYLFDYLPLIVECNSIDELRALFPQEGEKI